MSNHFDLKQKSLCHVIIVQTKMIALNLFQATYLSDPDCMLSRITHKVDFTQDYHLFKSTKHPYLPPL